MTRIILVRDSNPLVRTLVEVPDLGAQAISNDDGIINFEDSILTEMLIRVRVNDKWVTREIYPNDTGGLIVIDLSDHTRTSEFQFGDRYDVKRVIGRGGMGIVIEATDLELDRRVAIKTLSRQLLGITEARNIFKKEARALARLDHRNLVHVHDVTESEGRPLMILEYVDGENLDERVERDGPLSNEAAWEIIGQVSDALSFLHSAGIIHRDLKPANIMIRPDHRVKLVDFGLARSLEQIYEKGTNIRGTPAYMAPEQLKGDPLTRSTDIYQFGVSLFEIMTGELPFDPGSMGYAHLHGAIPDPTKKRADLDPRIAELIRICLSKTANQRPTAEAIRRLADSVQNHSSGHALPEVEREMALLPEEESASWSRLKYGGVGALGLMGFLTIAILSFSPVTQRVDTVRKEQQTNAETVVQPPPEKKEPIQEIPWLIASERIHASLFVALERDVTKKKPVSRVLKKKRKKVQREKLAEPATEKKAVEKKVAEVEQVVEFEPEIEQSIAVNPSTKREQPKRFKKFKPKKISAKKRGNINVTKKEPKKSIPKKKKKKETVVPDSF